MQVSVCLTTFGQLSRLTLELATNFTVGSVAIVEKFCRDIIVPAICYNGCRWKMINGPSRIEL